LGVLANVAGEEEEGLQELRHQLAGMRWRILELGPQLLVQPAAARSWALDEVAVQCVVVGRRADRAAAQDAAVANQTGLNPFAPGGSDAWGVVVVGVERHAASPPAERFAQPVERGSDA